MKPRVLLLAIGALVTAGAAAYLAQGWLDHQRAAMAARVTRPAHPQPAAAVLVAAHALPAGSFVKPADLRWQPWPPGGIDSAYVRKGQRDLKSFVGAVARRGIAAGEPITDARLVKPGERGFLAAVLAPGLRAIAVPVNATSAIAGLVFPGDRVDLLLSHRFEVAGEDQNKRVTHSATETVLTNVRVLAIDQSTDDQKKKPDVPKTATIEVTPRQAEMVATAM
ncbi:MAG TPA: Flp pilus assembly protein CpaB, partial [Thermomicrobiales bacterium]|nr:Flp pilus assembly protein CpaB [Thermomicrobiales bacterium]